MKILKSCLLLLIVIAILAACGGFLYYQNYNNAINAKGPDERVAITIPAGSNTDKIADILKSEGLLADTNTLKLYLRLSGKGGNMKAGDYELNKNMSLIEIVDKLIEGAVAKGVRVTIPEGKRVSVTADLIEAEFNKAGAKFDRAAFTEITSNPDNASLNETSKSFLKDRKPAGKSLEGFLYPDTYEFPANASALLIVEKMLGNFIDKTEDLPLTSDGRSFFENLTMASIVEKESYTNEEKVSVASVFDNRLAAGMLLQSDATVNYATGNSNPRPTFQELAIDSPYNTYKYAGLPPGPVNSPRLASIEAAMTPADTDYYYFIHKQDASHQVYFARTLAEHNANVARYLD
jgi:UPF0755 protein